MKRLILIAITVTAALTAPLARAEESPITLAIEGGGENNALRISLSQDGRDYVILSIVELHVGGDICSHPNGVPDELVCKAPAIAGFEVNTGGGADSVIFTGDVPVPVTIRGGPGKDRLAGGAAADKIVGGGGDDQLTGRGGNDWIFGGPGRDRLFGGPGDDQLRGGPGTDKLVGGPGRNDVLR